MKNVKAISVLLTATSLVSVSGMSYADSDLKDESNMRKLMSDFVKDAKTLNFGPNDSNRYILNDTKTKDQIASLLSGAKIDSIKVDELKSILDMYISGNGFSIGFGKSSENGKYYAMVHVFDKNSDKKKTYTLLLRDNMYKSINELLDGASGVEVDYSKLPLKISSTKSRIDTSVKVSKNTFARANDVVLVGENSLPDSLVSSSLAGHLNAPILLSSKDSVDEDMLREIERLHAKNIHIVSGNDHISKSVIATLKEKGYSLIDYSGKNRYETAKKISNSIGSKNDFIVASGENMADIPSISPYAFDNKTPIVLISREGNISSGIEKISKGDRVIVAGGEMTISKSVYDKLKSKNVDVKRIAGQNRFKTSKAIVDILYPKANFFLFTNDKDALLNIVASPMSSKYKRPLLILDRSDYTRHAERYFLNEEKVEFFIK